MNISAIDWLVYSSIFRRPSYTRSMKNGDRAPRMEAVMSLSAQPANGSSQEPMMPTPVRFRFRCRAISHSSAVDQLV